MRALTTTLRRIAGSIVGPLKVSPPAKISGGQTLESLTRLVEQCQRDIYRQKISSRVLYLMVLGLITIGGIVALHNTKKISTDEHNSCIIQARGLPAGHALANSMSDIHALLTLPPTTAQTQQRAQIPPQQLAYEEGIFVDLNINLTIYTQLESKQPLTRKC